MNQIDVLFDVMKANNFYDMPAIKKADVKKYMTSKAYDMLGLLDVTYSGKTLDEIPGSIVSTIISNVTTHDDWTIEYTYMLYGKSIVDKALRHWAHVIYDNTVAYLNVIDMPNEVSAVFSEVEVKHGFLITGLPVVAVSAKVNKDCTIRQLRDSLDAFKDYAKKRVMANSRSISDCRLRETNVKFDYVECVFSVI